MRRVGTANSMLSPRTGTAVFREAGSPADTAAAGNGRRGASGQRAFGAFRWRLESPRWRIRPETRMEGGSGARMGDVLAPSPVESDMMLAATCGAAWWAGFTPRGIPIGRVVGSLARIGVRANSRCLPGSQIFSDPPCRTSAASRKPETRSPSEGSLRHTHSRRDVRACRWVAPPRGPRFAPRLERRARWDARSTLPPPPAPDARVRVPRGERRVQVGTSARDARPPPRVVAAGTTCVVPPGGDPQ